MLSLVSGPVGYPITVDDVKQHARIEVADDDILLEALIAAATDHAEQMTQRALITQEWDYYVGQLPCETFEIPKPPLQEIISVKYLDTSRVEQTLPGTSYKVIAPQGPTAGHGVILPLYGGSSFTRAPAHVRDPFSVVIRFRCGYGNAEDEAIPDMLKLALLEFVADTYENRENSIVTTTTMAALEVPLSVKTLLWPFVVDKLGI